MSSFTTPLVVSPMEDGRRWKLVEAFRFRTGKRYQRNRGVICVPAGFITDFASIPWLFWMFLPAWGKYGKAAVLHDWIYFLHRDVNILSSWTRKQADQIFLEAMLVSGTKPWKAKVMYWAVRLFGWAAWRK